jgi:hypothetical protein
MCICIYGKILFFFRNTGCECVIYNLHNLIHLVQCCCQQLLLPLDSFSEFPFENFLGQLKSRILSDYLLLEQVINCIQLPGKEINLGYSPMLYHMPCLCHDNTCRWMLVQRLFFSANDDHLYKASKYYCEFSMTSAFNSTE